MVYSLLNNQYSFGDTIFLNYANFSSYFLLIDGFALANDDNKSSIAIFSTSACN
jgi:hypothetical protein